MAQSDTGSKRELTTRPSHPIDEEQAAEWDAKAKHMTAVGEVASAWAHLETSIDDACIRLADLKIQTGIFLTSQIAGSGRKMVALLALAQLRNGDPKAIADLRKFAEHVSALAQHRN